MRRCQVKNVARKAYASPKLLKKAMQRKVAYIYIPIRGPCLHFL